MDTVAHGIQMINKYLPISECYICEDSKKAVAGACMQCNKSGCKTQFHVTCAQTKGLLCEEAGNYLDNVKYCGYCEHHYSRLVGSRSSTRRRSKLARIKRIRSRLLQKKSTNVKTVPPFKPSRSGGVDRGSGDPSSSPENDVNASTSTGAVPPTGSITTSTPKSSSLGGNNSSSTHNSSANSSSSSTTATTTTTNNATGPVTSTAPTLATTAPPSVSTGSASSTHTHHSHAHHSHHSHQSHSSSTASKTRKVSSRSSSKSSSSAGGGGAGASAGGGGGSTSSSSTGSAHVNNSHSGTNANNSTDGNTKDKDRSSKGLSKSSSSSSSSSSSRSKEVRDRHHSSRHQSSRSSGGGSSSTSNKDGHTAKGWFFWLSHNPFHWAMITQKSSISNFTDASSTAIVTNAAPVPKDHFSSKFTTSNFTETIVVNSGSVFCSDSKSTNHSASNASNVKKRKLESSGKSSSTDDNINK